MSIGSRIQEQRKKANLTQQELALKIDLSLNMIKRLETNRARPSIETLEKLVELFGCSADYLLGIDNFDKSVVKMAPKEFQAILDAFAALTFEQQEAVIDLMKKLEKEQGDKV